MRISSDTPVVVTGGASGLGLAVAHVFAEAGAPVGIFDLNADQGAAVAQDLGGTFAQVDVADPVSVRAGFDTVLAAGPIPAQFTKTRSWPFAARMWSKPARTLAGSATSTFANALPTSFATAAPWSALRSKIPTGAPASAKVRATASPNPEAPPVTKTGVSLEIRIGYLP